MTREKGLKYIVVFATAWGARHGGINAFNIDFCKALAKVIAPGLVVCCVVPKAEEEEINEARINYHIVLMPLGGELVKEAADIVRTRISGEVMWWVGHDSYSGEQANYGAKSCGGKSAVFHHMAYWLYSSAKTKDGDRTAEQDKRQREIGETCDLFFGVGPLLWKHARRFKTPSSVHEIVPGLQEIEIRTRAEGFFNVIQFGRMGEYDNVIKQGQLGAKAFGKASIELAKDCSITPTLTVIGLPGENEEYNRELLKLEKLVKNAAGKRLILNPLTYTEDRAELYRRLSEHHVCMMLSWHEGFGLVGWEAIAAEVPLIVSINSGLYKLLDEKHHTMTANVYAVDVKDSEEDVAEVATHLRWIAHSPAEASRRARELKQHLLEAGYTWENAAKKFAQTCGLKVRADVSREGLREKPRPLDGDSLAITGGGDSYVNSNPFQLGGTLPLDAPSYVRRDCDTTLERVIASSRLVFILGGFQIGKSSLLARSKLTPFIRERPWTECVFDLTAMSTYDTKLFYNDFLSIVSEAMVSKISSWRSLQTSLKKSHLLFCIDEFALLRDVPDLAAVFIPQLCSLAQEANLRVLVCTPYPIRDVLAGSGRDGLTNPRFAKQWTEIPVKAFDEKHVGQLLQLLPPVAMSVAMPQCGRIVRLTEGQPVRVQAMCHKLYEQAIGRCSAEELNSIINEAGSYK